MKRVIINKWIVMSVITMVMLYGRTADIDWVGAVGLEGSWTNTANWSGGDLPGAGDTAGVYNGGTVLIDMDLSSTVNPSLAMSNGSTLRVKEGGATTNMTVSLYESNIEISGGLLHMPYDTTSYLGLSGTNRIVMTGGTLSGTARYGRGADVDTTLVLSNGTVVSEYYLADYGSAGGTATVIQEGGYHGWRLILGTGGTGRYFLNGGELYAPYPFIGRAAGTGYLEVGPQSRITLGGRDGTAPIILAYGSNAAGTLVLNSVTNNLIENGVLRNTFSEIRLCADTSSIATNSTGRLIFNNCMLALTNSIVFWQADNCQMDLIVNGGELALSSPSGVLQTLNWPGVNSDNTKATVTVTNGAVFSAGILNMYSGGKLINAGGAINVDPYTFKSYSTNTVVELLAGSMTIESDIQIGNTRATEFLMRDGHALQTAQFKDTTGGITNEFLLTYLLHKKPEWQVPITFTGTSARRNGHLRVALEGGVLLADTNACVVAETQNSVFYGNKPFMSVPDTNLWLENRSEDIQHSVVTLAEAGDKGNLAMGGTSSLTFDPTAMGYVSLENVTTRRLVDLSVRLDVEPQGETTLDAIVDGFVSAGYTNSLTETGSDGCNVTLAIPADAVYDTEGTAKKSYFIWDFTRTTAQAPDVVTTNAVISKISFAYSKLTLQGTVIFVR